MRTGAHRDERRQKRVTTKPRMMITLDPDMLGSLDRLKKEMFYDQTKTKMIQYLIWQGIRATIDALEAQDVTAQH